MLWCTQVVTESMWASRSERFPEETPSTKEYYLLRSIFEEHYPSPSALASVPKVSYHAVLFLWFICRCIATGTYSFC